MTTPDVTGTTANGQLTLPSSAPMKIARRLVEAVFRTEKGRQGLWEWRGVLLVWEGGRWQPKTKKWLRRRIWEALDNATVQTPIEGSDEFETGSYTPGSQKITEIIDAMDGMVQWDKDMPAWLDGGAGKPAADLVVAFEDKLVDIRASAMNGHIVTVDRDETLLTTAVIPRKWDAEAKCPVFDQKCGEWHPGDKEGLELRERFYGHLLQGSRKYRRALSEFGKSRGGKGTWTDLLLAMVGEPWYCGTQLRQLGNAYQSSALMACKVLAVSEVNEMHGLEGGAAGSILQVGLGNDRVSANRKYMEQEQVTYGWAPILQGNELLALPDNQGGLATKLLWVHFPNSFAGKEDLDLAEKLKGEMAGVARRWVEALVRLEKAEPHARWPQGAASIRVLDRYRRESNKWDSFLHACFNKVEGWFTDANIIREKRTEWEAMTGERLVHKDRTWVNDQDLLRMLEECSSWPIVRARKSQKSVQRRGLIGMAPKKTIDLGEHE